MLAKLASIKMPQPFGSRAEAGPEHGVPSRYVFAVASLVFLFMLILSVLKIQRFDYALVHLINDMSGRSWVLDAVMRYLIRDMFSNLLLMTLVWYVWFDTEDFDEQAKIAAGVIVSYIAGGLSRIIQLAFPAHPRPLHDLAVHFRPPRGVDPSLLNNWSSFPSDHATVFFGLATTVFLVNRKLGQVGFILSSVLIIARVYNGFHYPTDVIGGAALGILFVGLTQSLRHYWPFPKIVAAAASHRPVFYAAAFYLCFGVTTLFEDYRAVGAGVMKILKAHFHI
jgi:undecaprenyl-diphosphatase